MREQIYLDIKESKYSYKKKGITFYFSSRFYMNNFIAKAEEYALHENLKLEMRFQAPINMIRYFLIAYYKKLEKRGFRIEIDEKEYQNPPCAEVII